MNAAAIIPYAARGVGPATHAAFKFAASARRYQKRYNVSDDYIYGLGARAAQGFTKAAATKIQRFVKSRKSRKGFLRKGRSQLNPRMNKAPLSRVKNIADEAILNDSLFINPVQELIVQGPAQNDRRKNYADINGYLIDQVIHNPNSFPIMYHIAILSTNGTQGQNNNFNLNFFTSTETEGYAGMDFDSLFLTGVKKAQRPIYSRQYKVHAHKRIILQKKGQGGYPITSNNGDTVYHKSYVKINRRYWYDEAPGSGGDAQKVGEQLYMVRWWNQLEKDPIPAPTDTVVVERLDKCYFTAN